MVLLVIVQGVDKACLRASNFLYYMNLTVRYFLYAYPAVFLRLTELFNIMFIHGYVPQDFGKCVILPVIKDSLSVNKISVECASHSNYRPISIEPVCTKLFEQCLVLFLDPFMSLYGNQFGFAGGCNKALLTFRSTVQHFRDGGSRVYIASPDLTKAFDRINHFWLQLCLFKKGVPLCLINVLFCWFFKLRGTVRCNNEFSEVFQIKSGVPQSSINGLKFFNRNLDEILVAQQHEHLGCFINGRFAGALAYADDMLLLPSSLIMLQRMLDVCNSIGMFYDLKFNLVQTVCGVFGVTDTSRLAHVTLSDVPLDWRDKFTYLGITFLFGVSLILEVAYRIRKFHTALSTILKKKVLGFEHVYVKLLFTNCMLILFYGLDTLTVSNDFMLSIT